MKVSIENQNNKKYHIPGQSNYCKRKINQINLHRSTSLKHQLEIIKICTKLLKEGKEFITEAVPNDRHSRRIDIVNLSEGIEIEVETDPKIKKEGAKTIYV